MSLRRQTTLERFESERFFDFKNKNGAPLNDYLEPWLALMLYGYVNYFDDAWQELKDVCDEENDFDVYRKKLRLFTTNMAKRVGGSWATNVLEMGFEEWKFGQKTNAGCDLIRWNSWGDSRPQAQPLDILLLLTNNGEYLIARQIPGGFFLRSEKGEEYISRQSARFAAWIVVPKCPRSILDDDALEKINPNLTSNY